MFGNTQHSFIANASLHASFSHSAHSLTISGHVTLLSSLEWIIRSLCVSYLSGENAKTIHAAGRELSTYDQIHHH